MKNKIVKINDFDVTVKMYKGQRVVTFKDIDMVHERVEGTADRNFRENKDKFIEDEDYFILSKSQNNEIRGLEIPNRGLTLITESGYLMLVKSFTDDLAWDVQRKLVKSYFIKNDEYEDISTELKAVLVVDKRVTKMETKINSVDKDLQEFKQDLPILGVEESKITSAVKKKGVYCLGGKDSNAYKDKSLRGKLYSDIYGQLKRHFGVSTYKAIKRSQCNLAMQVIEAYEPPIILAGQIKDCNAQQNMEVA